VDTLQASSSVPHYKMTVCISDQDLSSLILIIILFIVTLVYFLCYYHPKFYDDDLCNQYSDTYHENIFTVLKDNSIIYRDTNLGITPVTPNILFQTYYDKSKIPTYIYEDVSKYACNYEHVVFDDVDAIEFLDTFFRKKVVRAFKHLKVGAHKADLLRYCLLYIYGGVYIDIKTILLENIDNIFTDKTIFYSVLGFSGGHIHQGIIASPPRNILFLALISFCVNHVDNATHYYFIFIHDLYKKISNDTNIKQLKPGLTRGDKWSYYLLEESCGGERNKCKKLDQHGKCCYIYDKGKRVIGVRDTTYPWR